MNRWTRLGIEAYRAGNRAQAQRFFRYAMMENPGDVRPWLWMVEVAQTDAEKLRYLDQVLVLDPENGVARQAQMDLNVRMQSANLPHVSPFSEFDMEPPAAEALLPASTPIASTPPFMLAAVARIHTEVQPAAPAARIQPVRNPRWRLLAGMLLGLVVLSVVILLLVRPF